MFRSVFIFCFKQKTAYEMRISDWSSDVCSSDLHRIGAYGRGLCGHVLEGMLLGITQGLLVAAGASADDIAYPREDVAEQVGADDGIAGDDAQVLDDPAAFDSIGGDDQHRCLLPAERQPAYTACTGARMLQAADRKSTRLNSSH